MSRTMRQEKEGKRTGKGKRKGTWNNEKDRMSNFPAIVSPPPFLAAIFGIKTGILTVSLCIHA